MRNEVAGRVRISVSNIYVFCVDNFNGAARVGTYCIDK
jgi:hypothetical protein